MKSDSSFFTFQYALVQQSRYRLFYYCKTLSAKDFLAENSAFGRGSVRNLLVHVANAYEYWIVKGALQKDITFTAYSSIQTEEEAERLFASIDGEMLDFIVKYGQAALDPIDLTIQGVEKHLSPFELFTHAITHEIHHKGQILSLSRHLGYTPIDTDIIL